MKDAPVNPISEDLIEPGPNFAPWISGPRVCLGMKFAQVGSSLASYFICPLLNNVAQNH